MLKQPLLDRKNIFDALNLKLSLVYVLILIFFCVPISNSQQLPFSHLSISDGLEDTVIFAIEQDQKGFLWITTRTGINRFDGEQFWRYGEDEGLPHNLARDILKIADGTLWVAGERGVAWFDGEKFITLPDWPEKTTARAFQQARDGSLWVATYGSGVLQVSTGDNPKIIKQYNTDTGLPSNNVRTIFIDTNDDKWLGLSNNAVLIKDETIQIVELKTKQSEIRTIYQHHDGEIWVGTRHGVAFYNGENFVRLEFDVDLSQQTINSITLDHSKNVWIATRGNGVYKIDIDGKVTHLDMSDGLPDNSINTIFQDNENNMWFGTYGGGIARLSTSKVVNWKAQTGLPNPNVYAIAEDKNACIWIGTNGNGVSKLCNGEFSHITKDDGLAHNKVLSTIIDNNGDPWFGTLDGISHLHNQSFVSYGEINGMAGMVSYQIIQVDDGSYWIATNNGLNHMVNGRFIQYGKSEGLPDNRVNRILQSNTGGLWLATANGLSKFNDGKFTNWTTDDGLPANFINDLYEEKSGGLWIATNNGLGFFQDGEFKKWTSKDGLSHNNATVILPGNNGDIWVGTNRGVSIFNGENFTVITSREGLVFDLINRGAGYRDPHGNLWFGTGEGMSRFASDYKTGASNPPPVHLLSVRNNTKVINTLEKPIIKQQNSSLHFDYSAISFQRAPDVRYRYRLSTGENEEWRETRIRELRIESLAAGDYTFEVTARIGQGQWNIKPATFSFTISPPFWQTIWFGLMVLALLIGAFYLRNKRSALHAIKLENMVAKRTQQLEELNHGLEWYANHDSLTRLANRNQVHQKLSQLKPSQSELQLGIIVIDLDYFKSINDNYGHSMGDKALEVFANMLNQMVRDDQIAARWGGEEFLVVCPKISETRLKEFAKQILNHCRDIKIPLECGSSIKMRCSLGFTLTIQSQQQLNWEKAIQLADLALYNAKHSGRDCGVGYVWQNKPDNKADLDQALSDYSTAINQGLISRVEVN